MVGLIQALYFEPLTQAIFRVSNSARAQTRTDQPDRCMASSYAEVAISCPTRRLLLHLVLRCHLTVLALKFKPWLGQR